MPSPSFPRPPEFMTFLGGLYLLLLDLPIPKLPVLFDFSSFLVLWLSSFDIFRDFLESLDSFDKSVSINGDFFPSTFIVSTPLGLTALPSTTFVVLFGDKTAVGLIL